MRSKKNVSRANQKARRQVYGVGGSRGMEMTTGTVPEQSATACSTWRSENFLFSPLHSPSNDRWRKMVTMSAFVQC
jgi:hypothetical protein